MSRFGKAVMRLRYSLDVVRLLVKKYGLSGLFTLAKDDILFDFRYGVDTTRPLPKKTFSQGNALRCKIVTFPQPLD
jgi:hypothetical protein